MTVLYRMTTKEWRNDDFFVVNLSSKIGLFGIFFYSSLKLVPIISSSKIDQSGVAALIHSKNHCNTFTRIWANQKFHNDFTIHAFHWTSIGRTFGTSANRNKIKINFKYFWLTNFFLRAHPDWSISIQKQTN